MDWNDFQDTVESTLNPTNSKVHLQLKYSSVDKLVTARASDCSKHYKFTAKDDSDLEKISQFTSNFIKACIPEEDETSTRGLEKNDNSNSVQQQPQPARVNTRGKTKKKRK